MRNFGQEFMIRADILEATRPKVQSAVSLKPGLMLQELDRITASEAQDSRVAAAIIPNLDPSEEAAMMSKVGTVSDGDAQVCQGTINVFVENLEEAGSAGLSEASFEMFELMERAIATNASQETVLKAIYALTKTEFQPIVGDCVLTVLAYLAQVDVKQVAQEGLTEEEQSGELLECPEGMSLNIHGECIVVPTPIKWGEQPAPFFFGKYMNQQTFYIGLGIMAVIGIVGTRGMK